MAEKREIPGLNILKGIAALLVVLIHSPFVWKEELMMLCRTAVPLFYMITGYFLINAEGEITERRLTRMFWKILKLDLAIQLGCMLFNLAAEFSGIESSLVDTSYSAVFSLRGFINTLTVGSHFGFHLWYLNSLLQALVVILLVVKWGKIKLLYWSIPLGLAANLLLGSYGFLLDGDISVGYRDFVSRNFFTCALPCVAMGMWLRGNADRLMRNGRLTACITLVVLVAAAVEYAVLRHHGVTRYGNLFIFTIPLAVLLFLLALRVDGGGFRQSLVRFGANHSRNIYLFHYFPLIIIGALLPAEIYDEWGFPIVAVAAILFSMVWARISTLKLNAPKIASEQ